MFCMALVVKRPPLHEIKREFVLTVIEFRIESYFVIDCLTAGVIKILRSLLPNNGQHIGVDFHEYCHICNV